MSLTLDVYLASFVIPCEMKIGCYRFTMLQLLALTKWFFIWISIIHDNILIQDVKMQNMPNEKWINEKQVGVTILVNFFFITNIMRKVIIMT